MTEDNTRTSARSRRLLRWGPFGAAALLLAAFAAIDHGLKTSDAVGFAHPESTWHAAASDLPRWWAQWESLPAVSLLQESAPPILQETALHVRKLTGIRPTPSRLRFWLGAGGVLSGTGETWCLSFRPGLALRIASGIHGLTTASPDTATRAWGAISFAWRDGYLLVASSPDAVETMLEKGIKVTRDGLVGDGIRVSWVGEQPGDITVHARNGLPFDLNLPKLSDLPAGALQYTNTWPDALLTINARGASTLTALKDAASQLAATWTTPQVWAVWDRLGAAWMAGELPPLAPEWCGEEVAWAVFYPNVAKDGPDIRFGAVQQNCAPEIGETIGTLDSARAHRWDSGDGWLISSPQYRSPLAVCAMGDSLAWANDPTLVPTLLGINDTSSSQGTLALQLRWGQAGRLAKDLLSKFGEEELIPEMGREDIQKNWTPYVDALRAWSSLSATGVSGQQGLHIQGTLADPGVQ